MRVDTHVHTSFSGNTTRYPLKYLLRESYNSPEGVYRRAKARGMDLVGITDHDTIAGALTIADRPDVLVGCTMASDIIRIATGFYQERLGDVALVDRRYRLILPHRFLWPGGGLWSVLNREQPELVEICDKYSLCYLAGMVRTLRRRRPALVGLTCERMDDNVRAFLSGSRLGAGFARRYIRDVYVPQFDAHIANSAYTAAEIPHNPRHPRPVYVRHMGVDTITFTPARRDRPRRDRRRAALGLPSATPLLVYAGRLSAEKHPHLLVDMMCHLQRTAARLMVAGDGPLRPALVRRAAAECPGRIHFLDNIPDRDAAYFDLDDHIASRRSRETEPHLPVRSASAGVRGGTASFVG